MLVDEVWLLANIGPEIEPCCLRSFGKNMKGKNMKKKPGTAAMFSLHIFLPK
jgi:hypothetical protein